MFVIIDIYSKNKHSLQLFCECFLAKNLAEKFRFNTIKVSAAKKIKIKKFTILKSPHVNKTAQEQFEHRVYKRQVRCFVPQFPLFMMFFKKLRFHFLSDINCKIKIISNIKANKRKFQFNTDTYKLNVKTFNLLEYLKILSLSGECFLLFKGLDSSVG